MLNNLISLYNGGAAASTTSYESIATVTLGSSASTITFSSIPSTYKHLQVRGMAIASAGTPGIGLQFNGDTTTKYPWHLLQGNGSAASANADINGTNIYIGDISTSSAPGALVIDILDYANTNKYKTVRALAGYDANGSGIVALKSGFWPLTTAISSLTIMGTTFATNTSFALYGVKG